MKVVIFGQGVTGSATGAVFERAGIEVAFVDPPKGYTSDRVDFRPDYVFSCVPTPTGDTSYVEDVLTEVCQEWPGTPVVIRSTLPPGCIERLEDQFRLPLLLMPEFLREQYAVEDALRQDKCIYATNDDELAEKFALFLQQARYQTPRRVSLAACEVVKTALNSMLAVKVAFANVLYDVARSNGANYDELVDLLVLDGWLSKFGLQVPGRHGRGYSGTCLPKDLGWLTTYMIDNQIDGHDWLQSMAWFNERLLARNETPKEVFKEAV